MTELEGQGLATEPEIVAEPLTGEVATTTTPETVVSDPEFDSVRGEIVKRFGERGDKEYLKEVWKSYRNMEGEMSKTGYQELKTLSDLFGGVDSLKRRLLERETPSQVQNQGQVSQYTPEIQKQIDSGWLDPNDPKDKMLIDTSMRLAEIQNRTQSAEIVNARNEIDKGLAEKIAPKYPSADMTVIKKAVDAGYFKGMTTEQFWTAADKMANELHTKVEEKINTAVEARLNELKTNAKKSVITGKAPDTKVKKTPLDAFEDAWSSAGYK